MLVDPKLPEAITIGARKYFVKPATVAERTRWRRAIAAGGGRQHGPAVMLNCLAAGIRALYADNPEGTPVRDALLAKIDAQRVCVTTFYEAAKFAVNGDAEANQVFLDAAKVMAEGEAGLAVIIAEVSENYPAYVQLVADEAMYWVVAGIEACRMFMTGWEGLDMPFVRGPAGVTDDCLAEIPEADLPVIGQLYENLIRVTPQQRKNLLSLPPTSSGSETSNT